MRFNMRYLVGFAARMSLNLYACDQARELSVEPAHDGARVIIKTPSSGLSDSLDRKRIFM